MPDEIPQAFGSVSMSIPSAGIENQASDLPYNKQITIKCVAADKMTFLGVSCTIAELIRAELVGCGMVYLHAITVKYKMKGTGTSIMAGVFNQNFSKSIEMLGGLTNFFDFTSNTMTFGQSVIETLVVPDLYSRQIQPASSVRMPMRLYLKADLNVDVWVTLQVKFTEIEILFKTLTFAASSQFTVTEQSYENELDGDSGN